MQRPRTPSRISDSLHQRLNSYALAASAAGVSLVALAQPGESLLPIGVGIGAFIAFSEVTEAKVVFTPDNRWLSRGGFSDGTHRCSKGDTLPLDLNHDGNRDFTLCSWGAKSSSALSVLPGLPGHRRSKNMIAQVKGCFRTIQGGSGCFYVPAPLQYGKKIGPKTKWGQGRDMQACVWYETTQNPPRYCYGAWSGQAGEDAYLGFKFQIKGKPHYGWEHAVISYNGSSLQLHSVGYAYETIPNKPITAGKTKGKDVITLQPGNLFDLATGASAISAWRGANPAK